MAPGHCSPSRFYIIFQASSEPSGSFCCYKWMKRAWGFPSRMAVSIGCVDFLPGVGYVFDPLATHLICLDDTAVAKSPATRCIPLIPLVFIKIDSLFLINYMPPTAVDIMGQ